jgi:hypothetical protein
VSVPSDSTQPSDLKRRFVARAGLSEDPSVWELVNAVKEIPYGRPSERSADGVVSEWRGTCSTKHALLAALLADRPEFDFQLFHRVYQVSPGMFGERLPPEPLTDVHTYGSLVVEGRPVLVDVTFPGEVWDGRSDMTLACGEGEDYPAGDEPWQLKASLVERFCDPSVREPFIAALSG